MRKQISNEQEFQDNLKKLGELYEKGKDALNEIFPLIPSMQYDKIFNVLKGMRDLAAVQMQHKHWINEN